MIVVGLVIALVVAILFIVAISGRFTGVQKFGSCAGQSGTCTPQSDPCPDAKPATVFTEDCKKVSKGGATVDGKCCISSGG